VTAEFFHADGRIDRHGEANNCFSQFAETPKSEEISYSGLSVSRTSLVNGRDRFFLVHNPYKLKTGLLKKEVM
jgi:hypothetical protein